MGTQELSSPRHAAHPQSSPPLSAHHHDLELIPLANCDESAVHELWQEVREYCDSTTEEFPMAPPQSVSSSLPPPVVWGVPSVVWAVPAISLSAYLEWNGILVQHSERTTPEIHFRSLVPRPTLHTLDAMQESIKAIQRFKWDNYHTWRMIEDVFFPQPLHLKAPYFKVDNATLSAVEISPLADLMQQAPEHARLGAKPQAQNSSQTSTASSKRAGGPLPARSTRQPPSRSTSKVSRDPTAAPSTHSSSFPSDPFFPLDPFRVQQFRDDLLRRLLPHTTFWLIRPADPVRCANITGVLETYSRDFALMFPYLTIVQKSPGESVREVTDRVALIAYIVLSSHVKALKGLGRSDQLLACLRHYVIAVDPDRLGYEVYEAKQDPDGLTGYLVSSIDGGDLNNGAERFSLWLDMIHEWAEKTWKPMMMEAFSPEYLHYRNPVPQAGAKNEVENVWAQ